MSTEPGIQCPEKFPLYFQWIFISSAGGANMTAIGVEKDAGATKVSLDLKFNAGLFFLVPFRCDVPHGNRVTHITSFSPRPLEPESQWLSIAFQQTPESPCGMR
jgi:hypothetical protein